MSNRDIRYAWSPKIFKMKPQLKRTLAEFFRKAKLDKYVKKIKQYLGKLRNYLPIDYPGIPKGCYESTEEAVRYSRINLNKKDHLQTNFYRQIHPSQKISRSLKPIGVEKLIHFNFEEGMQHEFPSTFVAILSKARVWGPNGAVITEDNKLLADVSLEFGKTVWEHPIFFQWRLSEISNIQGSIAVLSSPGGNNYFHWMFDILPRLELLLSSGINLDDIDYFLVNSYELPFQQQTLTQLGISYNKVLESSKYPHIKADCLVVPSFPGYTGNMPDWSCRFLRKIFLNNMQDKATTHERIYISRSMTTTRNIVNENEVMDCLNKFGFTTIFLENLSVIEQAALFNRAKVVLAPHGAGLTNLVFCQPKTKIIELFSPLYVNVCYWALSNHLDLEYYYFLGKTSSVKSSMCKVVANILVDKSDLSNFLSKILG